MSLCQCLRQHSRDLAKQLLLQDELALLVLLGTLVRLIILPPNHLFALSASDVAHGVTARGHVAVARLGGLDVDDAVEEEGFAVLAAEVLDFGRILVSGYNLGRRSALCERMSGRLPC